VRTLTRKELTAALAARQFLIERQPLAPAQAIARLTPLQGQDVGAPYVALAARLEGFARADLEAAFTAGDVVKTTIMRTTLHIAAASEYPAFAAFSRLGRMRAWRETYAHLDEEHVVAELSAFLAQPREYDGVPENEWAPIMFARHLLPLIQVAPAGLWGNRKRPRFVVDERPLPDPTQAAVLVLRRYLQAFGPASRRDAAGWSGVPQRDFAHAWERVDPVTCLDERGTELYDLPAQPLPPASTKLAPRFLSRWDQALLAYADRDRIIPPELLPLRLTLSGDQTLTVDGRVAASWWLHKKKDRAQVEIKPHTEIPRRAHASIRAEAKRTALFCAPDTASVEVAGL
jgi:hypothetical protein